MSDDSQSDQGIFEQGIGCAVGQIVAGVFIVGIGFYSNLGSGTRPIGTLASLIFGSLIVFVGVVGIVVGLIKKLRQR